ncbi:hypothetical protein K377_08177, partial [Streptomyces sp. PsTaAH-137]
MPFRRTSGRFRPYRWALAPLAAFALLLSPVT